MGLVPPSTRVTTVNPYRSRSHPVIPRRYVHFPYTDVGPTLVDICLPSSSENTFIAGLCVDKDHHNLTIYHHIPSQLLHYEH